MSETNKKATEIAAKSTGLRADQVARAVAEYRKACEETHPDNEADWQAFMHVSGKGMNMHQYRAEGTEIVLIVECFKGRQENSYYYKGKHYEIYAEARAAELEEKTRVKLYTV